MVPITAKTGQGLDELLQVAHRQMHLGYTFEPDDLYDSFTHDIHHRMGELLHDYAYAAHLPAHWQAISCWRGTSWWRRPCTCPGGAGGAARHHRRV